MSVRIQKTELKKLITETIHNVIDEMFQKEATNLIEEVPEDDNTTKIAVDDDPFANAPETNAICEDIAKLILKYYEGSTLKTRKTQVSIVFNQLEDLLGLDNIHDIQYSDLRKLSLMDIISLRKVTTEIIYDLISYCAKYGINFVSSTGWGTKQLTSDKVKISDKFINDQENLMKDDLAMLEKAEYVFDNEFEEEENIKNTMVIINRCRNRLSSALSSIKKLEEISNT